MIKGPRDVVVPDIVRVDVEPVRVTPQRLGSEPVLVTTHDATPPSNLPSPQLVARDLVSARASSLDRSSSGNLQEVQVSQQLRAQEQASRTPNFFVHQDPNHPVNAYLEDVVESEEHLDARSPIAMTVKNLEKPYRGSFAIQERPAAAVKVATDLASALQRESLALKTAQATLVVEQAKYFNGTAIKAAQDRVDEAKGNIALLQKKLTQWKTIAEIHAAEKASPSELAPILTRLRESLTNAEAQGFDPTLLAASIAHYQKSDPTLMRASFAPIRDASHPVERFLQEELTSNPEGITPQIHTAARTVELQFGSSKPGEVLLQLGKQIKAQEEYIKTLQQHLSVPETDKKIKDRLGQSLTQATRDLAYLKQTSQIWDVLADVQDLENSPKTPKEMLRAVQGLMKSRGIDPESEAGEVLSQIELHYWDKELAKALTPERGQAIKSAIERWRKRSDSYQAELLKTPDGMTEPSVRLQALREYPLGHLERYSAQRTQINDARKELLKQVGARHTELNAINDAYNKKLASINEAIRALGPTPDVGELAKLNEEKNKIFGQKDKQETLLNREIQILQAQRLGTLIQRSGNAVERAVLLLNHFEVELNKLSDKGNDPLVQTKRKALQSKRDEVSNFIQSELALAERNFYAHKSVTGDLETAERVKSLATLRSEIQTAGRLTPEPALTGVNLSDLTSQSTPNMETLGALKEKYAKASLGVLNSGDIVTTTDERLKAVKNAKPRSKGFNVTGQVNAHVAELLNPAHDIDRETKGLMSSWATPLYGIPSTASQTAAAEMQTGFFRRLLSPDKRAAQTPTEVAATIGDEMALHPPQPLADHWAYFNRGADERRLVSAEASKKFWADFTNHNRDSPFFDRVADYTHRQFYDPDLGMKRADVIASYEKRIADGRDRLGILKLNVSEIDTLSVKIDADLLKARAELKKVETRLGILKAIPDGQRSQIHDQEIQQLENSQRVYKGQIGGLEARKAKLGNDRRQHVEEFDVLRQQVRAYGQMVKRQEDEVIGAERAKLITMLGQLTDNMTHSVRQRQELEKRLKLAEAGMNGPENTRAEFQKQIPELRIQIEMYKKAESNFRAQFEYRLRALEKNTEQRPESYWSQFKDRFMHHLATVPFYGDLLKNTTSFKNRNVRDDIYREWQYAQIGFNRETASREAWDKLKTGPFDYFVSSLSNLLGVMKRNPTMARQYNREITRAIEYWSKAFATDPNYAAKSTIVAEIQSNLAKDVILGGLVHGFVQRADDPKEKDKDVLGFLQLLSDTGTLSTYLGTAVKNISQGGLIGGSLGALGETALNKLKTAAADAVADTIPQQKKKVAEALLTYLSSGDPAKAWSQYKSREGIDAIGEVVNAITAPKDYIKTRAAEAWKAISLWWNADKYKANVYEKIARRATPLLGAGAAVGVGLAFLSITNPVLLIVTLVGLGLAGTALGGYAGHKIANGFFAGTHNYDKELEKENRGELLDKLEKREAIYDPLRPSIRLDPLAESMNMFGTELDRLTNGNVPPMTPEAKKKVADQFRQTLINEMRRAGDVGEPDSAGKIALFAQDAIKAQMQKALKPYVDAFDKRERAKFLQEQSSALNKGVLAGLNDTDESDEARQARMELMNMSPTRVNDALNEYGARDLPTLLDNLAAPQTNTQSVDASDVEPEATTQSSTGSYSMKEYANRVVDQLRDFSSRRAQELSARSRLEESGLNTPLTQDQIALYTQKRRRAQQAS